jgi:hypothetical protein
MNQLETAQNIISWPAESNETSENPVDITARSVNVGAESGLGTQLADSTAAEADPRANPLRVSGSTNRFRKRCKSSQIV